MAQFIENSSLEGWKVIGSGGCGQIYKARHRQWACDVAIKLLRHDDGTNEPLLREIKMMQEASSRHVIRVLGAFKGQPPNSGWATQLGVVMELMERGSLASLQEALDGPPPWPLVFRLVHQVALGINYLHSLTRPVLHLDLKPQNVLLDDALNAKLTDFGLSRISYSVSQVSQKDNKEGGGTVNYMPPEVFGLTYKPKRASDIYSYGILLWSIVTGKQPYGNKNADLVMLRIPEGDRPLLDDIKGHALGLTELTRLMQRCWDNEPERRPQALECTTETEQLYKMHKDAIFDAVHEVQKKLDQKAKEKVMTEQVQRDQIAEASAEEIQKSLSGVKLSTDPPKSELDTLRVDEDGEQGLRLRLMKYSCEFTVDTNTVNRELKLSDNNRKVRRVREERPYPDHPERFDSSCHQLLCRDGLTGRCYWEVKWSGWVYIAMSYRGISRREDSDNCVFGYNDQSWSLICYDGRYAVCHNKTEKILPVSPSSLSGRVSVYVDCPAGSLSFYRVSSDSLIHLHTFNTTFTERLYPGFWLGSSSSVSLCSLKEETTSRPVV